MSHFLVFWHEDDHFGIYGVFNCVDDVLKSISKEESKLKLTLIKMGRIHEMEGKEVVDELYVEDFKDEIEVNMDDLTLALENGMKTL